ncbi:nucleotidyltransferase family protein [Mesobaculum littorinae]|uniref:Nucleotidyltransferase family protein n=1 Tax=Mesobaculum littorinae TaxID=2486419 RepID=A0A438AIV1_9RHOB|nr:nucleotidyltransferase family protein [Mesobaculum littorinae]RVV98606.1 nucleotidyltransferase family protein [Mesobaculum littorinae]
MRHPQDIDIAALIRADAQRWTALAAVEALGLPQGCIGAGFVRNLVWDHLHGRASDCRDADVDVLFFDPGRPSRDYEAELESRLATAVPGLSWSVRNQARMHERNGDLPYTSVADAMRFWPETATAIAVSRAGGTCRIAAPFGLHDLRGLVLRPTSSDARKVAAFRARIAAKGWLDRWPRLSVRPVRKAQ